MAPPMFTPGPRETLTISPGRRVTLDLPLPARSVTLRTTGGRSLTARPESAEALRWRRRWPGHRRKTVVTAEVRYDRGQVFYRFAVRSRAGR